jgi:L-asparaginase
VELLKMSHKVVFLGMGGTIAGTSPDATDNVGYRAGQLGVDHLVAHVPGLQEALDGDQIVSEQIAQVDSKDMDFIHWALLADRVASLLAESDVRSVVVTHGTDTLEETAFFLASVLPPALLADKPVVFTCAMRPATSQSPDGPQNMLDAAVVARSENASGVLLVCAGTVHGAREAQKVHPYRMTAFDSGDAGALAYVEEGRLRQVRPWTSACVTSTFCLPKTISPSQWPRVEIVASHAGADGAIVHALIGQSSNSIQAVRGLVVTGTGNGTLHYRLADALQAAQERGIRVVRATRCAWGAIVAGKTEEAVLPHYDGLSPVKSRIALMLELLCA